MKYLIATMILVAAFSNNAEAQTLWIEFDLDGVTGNGSDTASISLDDYIDVHMWIMGDYLPILSSNVTLCNHDGALEFQSYVSNLGPPWTITPPVISGNCVLVQAIDFTFTDFISAPFLQGTFIYRAVTDNAIAELEPDLGETASGWSDGFWSGTFEPGVNCAIRIGATATEATRWGEIKSLFR